MLDRPRRDERSMDLFPVLVELLFCEIGPSLDEADDADIAAGRHGGMASW
jgi:hypothetical protein